jgi:hypothetical protein
MISTSLCFWVYVRRQSTIRLINTLHCVGHEEIELVFWYMVIGYKMA